MADQLIGEIYAATLEPQRYDSVMELWGDHLTPLAKECDLDTAEPELDDRLSTVRQHFFQSKQIFDRMGRHAYNESPVLSRIASNPQPAMLVSAHQTLSQVNRAARDLLRVANCDRLADIPFSAGSDKTLSTALAALATARREGDTSFDHEQVIAMAMAHCEIAEHKMLLALIPIKAGSLPNADGAIAELRAIEIGWSHGLANWLQECFDLTLSELDVVKGIVLGQTPSAIAEDKDRSPATIRTQLKSVLRKTGAGSQVNLMRLVAGLVSLNLKPFPGGFHAKPAFETTAQTHTLQLEDGRQMAFETRGPQSGYPVIFVHGMLDGLAVTRYGERLLHRHKLRVISPWRPGFCVSSADPREGCPKRRFAADVGALLDHLDIHQCVMAGHMSGALFATTAAVELPDRVAAVANIAGGVPIRSIRQFANMTPRQRVVAYTARFTPVLLPPVLRAGVAQLDANGERAFMDALYPANTPDRRIVDDPEVYSIVAAGYHNTVKQGHEPFEIDARCVTIDWSADAAQCKQPMVLLHGKHDGVVTIESVRDYAATMPNAELVEHAEAGQLVFYQDAEFVLGEIKKLIDRISD